MRSSFFSFNIARSAMFTARGGLEVVSHNIGNASNQAFSRQFAIQSATSPLSTRDGRGMIGTGSHITGIGQHRDVFLDRMFWNENSSLGQHSAKNARLIQLELSLNELRQTGTVSGFGLFFNTLQNLNINADDGTLRTNTMQAARSIAEFVSMRGSELRRQQLDTNLEIELTVRQINSIGHRIRNLNEQISRSEAGGSRANDLRDERNRLIDELSLLVNVEVTEFSSQADVGGTEMLRTNVTINGQEFINGIHIRPLEVVPRPIGAERNPTDAAGLFDIRFQGGASFDMYSQRLRGQLRGLIDVRDGNNGLFVSASSAAGNLTVDTSGSPHTITITNPSRDDLNQSGTIRIFDSAGAGFMDIRYENLVFNPTTNSYTLTLAQDVPAGWVVDRVETGRTSNFKGIPHYMNKLNELVRTFSSAINDGLTRNGTPIPGTIPRDQRDASHADGIVHDIFVLGDQTDPNWRSQALFHFAVNDVLARNPELLAVSSDNSIGASHGDVIQGFIQVDRYVGLFSEGRLSDFLIAITGELGIDILQADRFMRNHHETSETVHIQRLSVMGVDINEEMVDMLRFQQIYSAAARLINVIDSIYDTTINRMGTGF